MIFPNTSAGTMNMTDSGMAASVSLHESTNAKMWVEIGLSLIRENLLQCIISNFGYAAPG